MPSSYSRSPRSSKSKEKKSRQRRSRSYQRRRDRSSSPKRDYRRGERIPRCRKLFITNISAQYSGEEVRNELEKAFVEYGKIIDTVVKTKQGSNNSYAFIEFSQLQSATKALQNMRGKMFKGKELKVEYGKGEKDPKDRQNYNSYKGYKPRDYDHQRVQRRNRDREYPQRSRRDEREKRSRSNHRHKYSSRRYESRSSSSSGQSYRRKRDHNNRRQNWDKDSRSPQKKNYHRPNY